MSKTPIHIKTARPGEAEAVRTTIVGGRPPGGGANVRDVPRGVEVLIKKAAVDPTFKKMLLEKRAGAAEAIALKLEPAEAAMLNAVPAKQLAAIVANTKVRPSLRPAFLGYAAAAMLAAVTVGKSYGVDKYSMDWGSRPDGPDGPFTAPELESFAGVEVAEGTGTIAGKVFNENNYALDGAFVKIGNTNFGTTSGAGGDYVITKIPPGEYDIKVLCPGFAEKVSEKVDIPADTVTIIIFTLTADNPKPATYVKGIKPDRP